MSVLVKISLNYTSQSSTRHKIYNEAPVVKLELQLKTQTLSKLYSLITPMLTEMKLQWLNSNYNTQILSNSLVTWAKHSKKCIYLAKGDVIINIFFATIHQLCKSHSNAPKSLPWCTYLHLRVKMINQPCIGGPCRGSQR